METERLKRQGTFDCVFFLLYFHFTLVTFGVVRRNNLYSKANYQLVIGIFCYGSHQQTHHFSLISVWPVYKFWPRDYMINLCNKNMYMLNNISK